LPGLVAGLGHEPLWEELPPGPDTVRAATVGRHGRFHWIGMETDQPVASVMDRIAQRLVRYGNASGVLVVYPAGRQLGIALGVGPIAGLVLDLDAPDPVALASLRRLRGLPAVSPTAFAARAADILTGRGMGHEFFRQFRSSLDLMAGAITGRRLRDATHRRALALLQLTRVLFLYFIQSRGWLDGRPDFLRRLLDQGLTTRRSVQRHLFDPLFFGTLNRPPAERSAGVRGLGAIPFLNGGLFEPHPLEQRYRPLTPDSVWRDVIDQLFERYHFAASEENASGGPAIAPDMLGHVFEGVMEPGRRKASGTFYTPAALVFDMVDAALAALVSARLGGSDAIAARRIASRDPEALAV